MFDTESPLIHVVDMKSKLTLCIAAAIVMILPISVNSAIATGAESDSDDRSITYPALVIAGKMVIMMARMVHSVSKEMIIA